MLENMFDCIIYLLATYGLLVLVFGAADMVRCRVRGRRPNVRVVVLVQDAEDHIEYIVRNVVKKNFASKALSDKNIIFVDMNSADHTSQLLKKLKDDFSSIEIIPLDERLRIFDDFRVFSPGEK
ncbi:MAG: hypothetical protein ABFD25_12000 [Clostridiaceae bacterium]